MKQIRILILVGVAAMALMATVGATAASATETALCKETVVFCPNAYPKATKVHAELETGAKFSLENPIGKVECAKSTLEFTTEQETAIPLGATVNAFTFGECSVGGAAVEIIALLNGTLDIELIDLPAFTHHGTLTFTGTEIKVVYKGLGGIVCRYVPGHSGILTGGAMATIDLTGNWPVAAGSSVFCGAGPAPAKGNYTVTTPEPLWVTM